MSLEINVPAEKANQLLAKIRQHFCFYNKKSKPTAKENKVFAEL
jgi:hypothetical protein